MNIRITILLIVVLLSQQVIGQAEAANLRCELRENPLGIDITEPQFSWEIRAGQRSVQQTSWQVIVSSSSEKLAKNDGDVWNSGKTASAESIHIPYRGKKLQSGKAYYWKVKLFTNKGETPWSSSSFWTMGLLNKTDWKAKWIGYDKASPWDSISQWSRLSARYFRKQFKSSLEVRRATVYISGLGLYELYINGKKIGDRVLAPAPTDYRKTVLYNTYDVTADIQSGINVMTTILGNGRFFTMRQNYKTQKHNTFGYPKMLLQLEIEYVDGTRKTIVTDESWKLNVDGPIRTNNEYDGEEYDATKEFDHWMEASFDDTKWMIPELVKAPDGRLEAQMNEPIKVMRSISPISIKMLGTEKFILDMGQNFSGWISLKAKGERGRKIKLRFAESLQPNGELYVANLRDARVTDIYTMKGGEMEGWSPRFVYHGFRYVEVTGYPGIPAIRNFEGQMVFDDLQTTGSFVCSDSIVNKIHRNAWWGIASDYKGMPIDCPQRNERQPWLGDRATGSGGEAFLFDNSKLYAKWLDDIEESQTADGAIPDVAPAFWTYYTDNVTWPGTYIMVADMLYRQFGDMRSIVKHYASMKKWMDYMRSKYMKNFIVTKDKYGDWCVPPESLELIRSKDSLRNTRGDLIATAYYYRLLQYLKKFAKLAGKEADIKTFEELAGNIRKAFNQKFFNSQTGYYDNNTVTSNLLPLYFDMTPVDARDVVFKNIYSRIRNIDNLHISTGVIGTQWLMRGLTRFDEADMAFVLASNKTYPSWGYMTENGATTIWELWNGNTASPQMNSQNHVMLLGDLLIWLYENLGGIKSDDQETAFRKIIMKPSQPNGLTFVNANYQSLFGPISSNWKKTMTTFEWDISIPPNTSATVYVPARSVEDISESGNPLSKSEGVRVIKWANDEAVLEIKSGHYLFESTLNKK